MMKVAKEIDDIAQVWLAEHKKRRASEDRQEKKDFMDVMLDIYETGQENLLNLMQIQSLKLHVW